MRTQKLEVGKADSVRQPSPGRHLRGHFGQQKIVFFKPIYELCVENTLHSRSIIARFDFYSRFGIGMTQTVL